MPVQNGTAGNDTLTGGALNDTLNGLGGNDSLTGGADLDILDGGAGNDTLDGGLMNDILKGGAGNDTFADSVGEDTMTGGTGNDIYRVDDVDDLVIELAGGGTDVIQTDLNNLSLADYDHVEALQLKGSAALNASGSDRSDLLSGNTGNNQLFGGKGNDTLDGVFGIDTLNGGLGNDTFIVDSSNDVVIEGVGGGKDTVIARGDYTLGAGQEIEVLKLVSEGFFVAFGGTGNEFANTIIGNDHDNTLDGGKGNDTLTGGKGSDIYVVDSAGDKVTETAGQGTSDSVHSSIASYTLGANLENLFLLSTGVDGTGNAANNLMEGSALDNTLDGGGGHDDLAGNGGADSLVGGVGNDSLNGGSGIDTMSGGAGNDTYDVHELADKVIEAAGGGIDLVRTIVDGVVLAANVENLTLQGAAVSGAGNTLANYITGNSVSNSLAGNDGNDTLDGGGGPDNLVGGKGDDTYFVNHMDDKVSEDVGKGKDTIFASTTYVLAVGHEIEVVTLTGIGDSDADGNNFANTINGNSGRNSLDGEESNDTLNGGDGNDTLDGGAGVDVMNGGKGDDTYTVDDAKDKVTEAAGQGQDTVFSTAANFTLGANIEVLLQSNGAVNAIGNTLANRMEGNNVGNKLDGAGGDDDIEGHSGADTLIGGAGNDTLDGGSSDDKMVGGAGNDVYIVSSLTDKITELAGGGIDLVRTEISGVTLAAQVENLELLSLGDISGTGNELSNYLKGGAGKNGLFGLDGNDTLDGGTNGDALSGGKGNDTYFIDNALDIIFEVVGQGKDTVRSSVTFNFNDSVEIETLILDSASSIGSVANNSANTITMLGAGAATINGNDGNDTLTGGSGNDTLLGGNNNDVVSGLGGNDLLQGGDNNDKLTGGEGNDELDGGAGKDTMIGGLGADSYSVTDVGDVVTELANQGHDIVSSTLANYTLAANVEELILAVGALDATCNALSNYVDGNSSNNKIDGAGGNDTLWGGAGNDSILGGLGFDNLQGASGNDTLKGGAGSDLINGGAGADVMYGEADKDGFLYRITDPSQLATLGGDTIHGFQTGIDKIELSSLLDEFVIDPTTALALGFVLLTKSGDDTLVQFDQDGVGGTGPLTLATVVDSKVATTDLMLNEVFL